MRSSRFFHGFHEVGSLRETAYSYLQTIYPRGLSQATYAQREDSLKLFVRWCEGRSLITLEEITPPIMESYQSWLVDAPLGKKEEKQQPNTIRTRLLDLRLLFRYCTLNNLILENPFSGIELGRWKPHNLPECLTEKEVADILSYPDIKTTLGIRDRTFLETLYSTGIRRRELLNLNLSDVGESRGIIRVVNGKGGKDRLVPIGKRALKWIYTYRGDSRTLLPKVHTSALFLNRSGYRLQYTTCDRPGEKGFRYRQMGIGSPFASLLRHPYAQTWSRYPNYPGDLRSQRDRLHLDLHPLGYRTLKTHPSKNPSGRTDRHLGFLVLIPLVPRPYSSFSRFF